MENKDYVYVRLPNGLKEKVDKRAESRGLTTTAHVRNLIVEDLANDKR